MCKMCSRTDYRVFKFKSNGDAKSTFYIEYLLEGFLNTFFFSNVNDNLNPPTLHYGTAQTFVTKEKY